MPSKQAAKTNRALALKRSIIKGKVAEEIAKEDFIQNGFIVYRTGTGSDFVVSKFDMDGKIRREFVEVKSGSARLSKLQKKKMRQVKKAGHPYIVYRVTDDYVRCAKRSSMSK